MTALTFEVSLHASHEEEMEDLQQRLNGISWEDAALLALGLLDAVSRHLQHADAEVRLFAPAIGWGHLDVAPIKDQMHGATPTATEHHTTSQSSTAGTKAITGD